MNARSALGASSPDLLLAAPGQLALVRAAPGSPSVIVAGEVVRGLRALEIPAHASLSG